MEGKHKVPTNIRLMASRVDSTTEHCRGYGLVRKNIREAWRLEKNFQNIEEEKSKVKISIEKLEQRLIIESEMVKKCSGKLSNNVNFIRSGLPDVIVSRTTTKRSRLPWQENRSNTKQKIQSNFGTVLPFTTIKQEKRVTTLPRLQKALEDSKKNVSEIALCCKRIPRQQNFTRRMNSIAYVEKEKTIKESLERINHLVVPDINEKKISKDFFQTWIRETKDDEGTEKDALKVPEKDYRRRSVSVNW